MQSQRNVQSQRNDKGGKTNLGAVIAVDEHSALEPPASLRQREQSTGAKIAVRSKTDAFKNSPLHHAQ
jgi:hypothetical protein